MGRRSQPRKPVEVPVRIFGADSHGQVFSEKVTTVNVSRNGVEVAGVRPDVGLDEIVGLTYGSQSRALPRQVDRRTWNSPSRARGPTQHRPRKTAVGFPPAADARDDYQPTLSTTASILATAVRIRSRFTFPRGHLFGVRVADLSLSGCYVEIPIPLELGKNLKVGIWFGQTKAWAEARVAHTTPGMGVGLRFTEISDQDLDQIRRYIQNLSPFARIPFRTAAATQKKL